MVGFAQSDGLLGAAGQFADATGLSDLVNILTGGDDLYRSLYRQEESGGILQYQSEPADRREYLALDGGFDKQYAFLLIVGPRVVQVPFLINPQRETITEPHAHQVQFLQGGGKLTQSDGGVIKEIQLEGTCGIYPRRHSATSLPRSGVESGFEHYKNLQNVFRRYLFLRRYGDLSVDLQLVYVNRRRQESWIVEPTAFTSTDAVEHNFTFKYQITLQCLYPYEGRGSRGFLEQLLKDALGDWALDVLGVIQRLGEAMDQLNVVATRINSFVDGFINAVWRPVLQLMHSLADAKANTVPLVKNWPRDRLRTLSRNMREAAYRLEQLGAPDLAKKVYDAEKEIYKLVLNEELQDSSATSKQRKLLRQVDSTTTQSETSDGTKVSVEEAALVGVPTTPPPTEELFGSDKPGSKTPPIAFQPTALQSVEATSAGGNKYDKGAREGVVGSATAAAAQADKKKLFLPSRTVGASSIGDQANLATSIIPPDELSQLEIIPPSSFAVAATAEFAASFQSFLGRIDPNNADYKVSSVAIGDDIKTLAQKTVGDSGLWPALVMLLGLKAPYVASKAYINSNGLTNVLAYGDKFIYPVPKLISVPSIRQYRKETDKSYSLSSFERSLGNDIYVDPNTGDIEWGVNDLRLVYGVENIAQAIRARLLIKKGSWRRATTFGLSEYVGLSRGIAASVIQAEVRALFEGDERITGTQVLEVRQVAEKLLVVVAVFVRDLQEPIVLQEEV